MWQQAVRRWHASCARAGRFGSHTFWESQYERGKAPNEWFLAAEQAATSTAEAFAAHEKVHGLGGPFAKVLHIGCGTSRLGNCLISALASHSQVSGRVMSVDYSAVAVAAPSPHSSDAPSRCSRSAIRERCRAFDTPTAAVFEVIEKVLPSVLVLQLTSAGCLAQQMESLGMGML